MAIWITWPWTLHNQQYLHWLDTNTIPTATIANLISLNGPMDTPLFGLVGPLEAFLVLPCRFAAVFALESPPLLSVPLNSLRDTRGPLPMPTAANHINTLSVEDRGDDFQDFKQRLESLHHLLEPSIH
jgi:hypothetical protein